MSDTTLIQRLQTQYGHPFTANGEARIDYSRHPLIGKAIAALEQQAAQIAEKDAEILTQRERVDFYRVFTREAQDLCQAAQQQVREKDAEIARLISTKEHIRKEINAMIGRVEDDAVLIAALRADAERMRSIVIAAANDSPGWYRSAVEYVQALRQEQPT